MKKMAGTIMYLCAGYILLCIGAYKWRTASTKSPPSYTSKIQISSSDSADRDHVAYVVNGTYIYDTPQKTFVPDIELREVPIAAADTSPQEQHIVTIYETAVDEVSGSALKEGRKRQALISYDSYCSWSESYAERMTTHKKALNPKIQKKSATPKKILLWNPFFVQEDYHVGFGDGVFRMCHCTHTCLLTADKRELESADAVIVHTFYLKSANVVLPVRTNPKQVFVFLLFENPIVSWHGMADYDYKDTFNLTMTYLDHPDTDIYMPLGDVVKRTPFHPFSLPTQKFVKNKERTIAWLVSNCAPFSERDAYVNRLSKFINVDVYGKCGNLECPQLQDYGITCMQNLSTKYYFYLAFENAFCDGYASEKVFKTMFFNMVPIVYGGANYTKLLPPYSFIDVKDFSSPKHLSKYLQYLIANPAKYLRYFKWKEDRMVVADDFHRARGFCKLCQTLNDPSYKYKSNFDLVSYWNPEALCKTGKKERKAVNLRL